MKPTQDIEPDRVLAKWGRDYITIDATDGFDAAVMEGLRMAEKADLTVWLISNRYDPPDSKLRRLLVKLPTHTNPAIKTRKLQHTGLAHQLAHLIDRGGKALMKEVDDDAVG